MPAKELLGTRYLRPDTAIHDLSKAVTSYLPGLDMDETLAFYDTFLRMKPTDQDHAFLALNDLFYLLIGMCDRRDAMSQRLTNRVSDVCGS